MRRWHAEAALHEMGKWALHIQILAKHAQQSLAGRMAYWLKAPTFEAVAFPEADPASTYACS